MGVRTWAGWMANDCKSESVNEWICEWMNTLTEWVMTVWMNVLSCLYNKKCSNSDIMMSATWDTVRSQGKAAHCSGEGLRNTRRVLTCQMYSGKIQWTYCNLGDHNPRGLSQPLWSSASVDPAPLGEERYPYSCPRCTVPAFRLQREETQSQGMD